MRYCRLFFLRVLFGTSIAIFVTLNGNAETTVFKIGGTGAALATMAIVGNAYSATRTDVTVRVLPSLGSGGGIRALQAGSLDLSLSARPLKADERAAGLEAIEYGVTAMVFAGNTESGPSNLTDAQIVRMYGADNPLWRNGERVRVILRPNTETDTRTLKDNIAGLSAVYENARTIPGVPTAYNDQENADLLARIPGSFGSLSLCQLISEERSLKVFSLNGVTANLATIKDGTYPITKSFYVVFPAEKRETTREFIRFLLSPEGRQILAGNGVLSE